MLEDRFMEGIDIFPEEELKIEEALKEVVDPELGINIVDLGLVYGVSKSSEQNLILDLTLTSPACPLTEMIEEQINMALVPTGMYSSVEINWVWSPPWTLEMISPDGREQMRSLGFNI